MPVSIDNALRILRRHGWVIGSDSQGAWRVERAMLTNAQLTDIASTLNDQPRKGPGALSQSPLKASETRDRPSAGEAWLR